MTNPMLVTGATGVLGRAIVAAAIDAGIQTRQAARNPAKANPAAEAVRLDYNDPATITSALEGISAIVLMAPPLDPNAPAQLGPVITAAGAAGAQHIILISAFGVDHNEQAPLRVVEHLVIDSGTPYTILRPNFFMDNFSEGPQAAGIRERNAIDVAAGDGKTSFIAASDIAAIVVTAVERHLTGREFDLTGPAALDHAEVAKIIGDVTGRPITYHPLAEEEMLAGARLSGMPEPAVAYLGVLYGVVRAGFAAGISGDFEAVTGRKPTTFAEFARISAAAWKKELRYRSQREL